MVALDPTAHDSGDLRSNSWFLLSKGSCALEISVLRKYMAEMNQAGYSWVRMVFLLSLLSPPQVGDVQTYEKLQLGRRANRSVGRWVPASNQQETRWSGAGSIHSAIGRPRLEPFSVLAKACSSGLGNIW